MLNKLKIETCPVCNARLKSQETCRRCKADLACLADVITEAENHMNQAVDAFNKGQFMEMFSHARKSHTLFCTRNSAKLMGCASLLSGEYNIASLMWKSCKKFCDNSGCT